MKIYQIVNNRFFKRPSSSIRPAALHLKVFVDSYPQGNKGKAYRGKIAWKLQLRGRRQHVDIRGGLRMSGELLHRNGWYLFVIFRLQTVCDFYRRRRLPAGNAKTAPVAFRKPPILKKAKCSGRPQKRRRKKRTTPAATRRVWRDYATTPGLVCPIGPTLCIFRHRHSSAKGQSCARNKTSRAF